MVQIKTDTSKSDEISSLIRKELASQVPTCQVLTTTESASSIQTQFQKVCEKLECLKQGLGAITIILEEKKCANMKQTINFILTKLRLKLGVVGNYEIQTDADREMPKDSKDFQELPSSDESEGEEKSLFEEREDFVSSFVDPVNYSRLHMNRSSIEAAS